MPSKDDRVFLDWEEVAPTAAPPQRRRRRRDRSRARSVVLASVIVGLLASPFSFAAAGDALREGVRNGTTSSETEVIGKFDATSGAKGGYVTRQSNTQTGAKAGGAAIYGCRGAAGGTAGGSAPCLRASNLGNGFAFELASQTGPAGLFTPGLPTDAPFAVEGTGRVVGLNADKVDGLDAAQLVAQAGGQGPAGPQGPAGAQGPAGTPDGYTKAEADARFARGTTKHQLARLELPAATALTPFLDLGDLGVLNVSCNVNGNGSGWQHRLGNEAAMDMVVMQDRELAADLSGLSEFFTTRVAPNGTPARQFNAGEAERWLFHFGRGSGDTARAAVVDLTLHVADAPGCRLQALVTEIG